jgi:hypothetical protein
LRRPTVTCRSTTLPRSEHWRWRWRSWSPGKLLYLKLWNSTVSSKNYRWVTGGFPLSRQIFPLPSPSSQTCFLTCEIRN